MMRRFVTAIVLLGMATCAPAQVRPNFAIFIADDLTFRDIGCYGGQARTPAIDSLAAQGMRFTRCFQAAPMCSPTRHCLYTGMYPVKTGAYPNHTLVSRPGTISIVQRLKAQGYRVALAGKTHIAPKDVLPFEYLKDPIDPAGDAQRLPGVPGGTVAVRRPGGRRAESHR